MAKDVPAGLQVLLLYIFLLVFGVFLLKAWVRDHDAFEWTIDGVHHVLILGAAK